jgi:hypothetical protein
MKSSAHLYKRGGHASPYSAIRCQAILDQIKMKQPIKHASSSLNKRLSAWAWLSLVGLKKASGVAQYFNLQGAETAAKSGQGLDCLILLASIAISGKMKYDARICYTEISENIHLNPKPDSGFPNVVSTTCRCP